MARKIPRTTPEEEAAFDERTRWIRQVLEEMRARRLTEEAEEQRRRERRGRLRRLFRAA
ncbi:MAG: hypothetical protein ACRDOS_02050 [Gaiellaceae bacterium]